MDAKTTYLNSMRKVLGTNVIVSEHFVDRLLERSRDQNHVLNIIKDIILKMKNEICVLIFESALNNRETRFRVYNGLHVVCKLDHDRMKLVLTTIY